jgi:hypothetical protein
LADVFALGVAKVELFGGGAVARLYFYTERPDHGADGKQEAVLAIVVPTSALAGIIAALEAGHHRRTGEAPRGRIAGLQ